MHPAPSVIFFTSFSGLGFGLLMWLGIGLPDVSGWVAFVFFFIAYALAVGGLLASTFHLGHPERALKAFTQWRSSWLSREGWCAVLALVLMWLYALGAVFLGQKWALLGILGSVFSFLTVFTTSMIYTQLKSVPRWNMTLTPPMFLSLSIAGGALLAGQTRAALILLLIAGAIQILYWIQGDGAFARAGTNIGTATGLGERGSVKAFEPPHTGNNYLLKEMAYVVGRKHATKLRMVSLTLMIALPVLLLIAPFSHALAAVAVLSHIAGVLVSRWLFFAQAEHVVGLYYGKR